VRDAGVEKDALGGRGLAGIDVRADADVAIPIDGVVRATVLLFLGLALVAGLTVDVEGSAESTSGSKPASSMVKARS
jgi:hypothetical protein